MKPYVAVFLGVFLAELGDKTQLATLFFATDAALSRWGVLAAAGGALVLSTGLAVTAGSMLGGWVDGRHLKVVAALGFLAIGLWILVRG
ncbi:MAG TPA: TMEM165/GDT1 family protein [Candidatus Acidoferrum sp.]|jgi:putative Ca2+/H+ antiporter (TMEM165/GDT1 family)|nr:TMEM165/GDT1 family protein [Candidatus Acidoferrum sp.]